MSQKNSWKDWIDIIAIGIMLCAVNIAVIYYFNIEKGKCMSNPLSYGAKALEESYGYPFIGTGSFMIENGESPMVTFDSSGASMQYPKDIITEKPTINWNEFTIITNVS